MNASAPTRPNMAVLCLFGAVLILWAVVMASLAMLIYALGGNWRDFLFALDLRKPTEGWFWWCLIVLPPGGALVGGRLAYAGRWRAALLIIPAVILLGTIGGVIAYSIDQVFL
jgi:hypothetical protein